MQVKMLGKQFEVAPEPADFWGWVREGRYDSEWNILKDFLRPEHTFIDLGAWVGSHSLFASTIARRVYAVEPDPVAFKILEQNVKGLPIHICQAAITGFKGTITLGSGLLGASTTRANRNEGGNIGPWEEGQTFDVPCDTLRNFIGDLPSGMVDIADCKRKLFIKIDVEGSEEGIMEDFEFFKEHKPTVYLESHPFWWRNPEKTWQDIRRVAALYKRVLNPQRVPIEWQWLNAKQIILTDEEQ